MVDITPAIPAGRQIVERYGGGRFRVSGISYQGSILVFPERTVLWPVTRFAEVDFETLDALGAATPMVELLLLGCGRRAEWPSADMLGRFKERKVVLEVMDTGAACRTYNVLMTEDRRVAAALIAVE